MYLKKKKQLLKDRLNEINPICEVKTLCTFSYARDVDISARVTGPVNQSQRVVSTL